MNSTFDKSIFVLFLLIFTCVYFINAWICDDAYITFRTVDNFVNGHGLTWNPGERVQAYTRPLWLFIISFFYFITRDIFYTTIFVSFFFCFLAVLICSLSLYNGSFWKACVFITFLISSKSFIDYSSSGLENPLSFFLIALFFTLLFSKQKEPHEFTKKECIYFFIIASLSFLNRQDTILLYLPILVCLLINRREKISSRITSVLVSTLPATAWMIFSLIYYGFIFPNTAYAKLVTGIPINLLLDQGLQYYLYCFNCDAVTLIVIVFSFLIVIMKKKGPLCSLAAFGVVLYLIYIARIGGDFFGGRFFSIPFFLCLFLMLTFIKNKTAVLILPLAALISILFNPFSPVKINLLTKGFEGMSRITDQRSYYYPYTGFLPRIMKVEREHKWFMRGESFKKEEKSVAVFHATGFFGFSAGPNKYIIDNFGLSDPLLSRLPVKRKESFWIGHFQREIPEGYVASIRFWKNYITDPYLHLYYDKIITITRGPIFSYERLKDIFSMNTGKFQYLLDADVKCDASRVQ